MEIKKAVKINYKNKLSSAINTYNRLDSLCDRAHGASDKFDEYCYGFVRMIRPYTDWEIHCRYITDDGVCFIWEIHDRDVVVCPVDRFFDYLNNNGSITKEEALTLCI